MKADKLSQYCEELVAEKGWDQAYKHARFMAQGSTDPSWGSVLKYLKSMKDGVAEGIEGSVVFSGTGDNGNTYEIIQSGDDYMIHANGRHIDTYDSLQRAMSVLKNEVPGLQQGVAESMDPDQQGRLNELIDDYNLSMKERSYWEADSILDKITREFGKDIADQVDQQDMAEGVLDEAVGMMIKGAVISGPNDQDIADRIAARTGGRVDSGSRGHHILIIYPTTQHRARAAAKIRKMFPGIELYKSGGNRNAIDEQGVAEGLPQTLRKFVPGYARREIDRKMDAEKFGRTDVDRDANYYRYKKIQDKIKEQGVAEGQTDYQKRRQRERDVDAGKPVKPPPKNPQNDYFARRKKEKDLAEVSLGDYRKKAAVSQAGAKIDRFFGRDDAAKVAAADQTIAKREKGLARADTRTRPYTPPAAAPADLEKQQRDLTAKYPNIDELVRRAELNRDPDYEMADGQAYYAARDAEQNYQKLRQIQRVIQGLNESLNRSHLP